MRKLLAAISAFKGLFSTVDAEMFFQVVFELEGFVAVVALELPQQCALVMADHVTLQAVHIGKRLVANLARLKQKSNLSKFADAFHLQETIKNL